MTGYSPRLTLGAVVAGIAVALFWLNVPAVPAVAGATLAGLILYIRGRRQASR
jgi:hypothetical protein